MMKLIIGNRNHSSWSLRAALVLELTGAEHQVQRIALFQPDSRARLLEHSPTGKVPVLHTADGPVWDSLAIAEYLAECFPDARLWPQSRADRARARSLCAEMHSGFSALRSHLPMDLARDQALPAPLPAEVVSDIQRIGRIWSDCLAASGGPFLFGTPGIVDAFFAPVAARLRSYRVALPDEAAQYVQQIYAWAPFMRWQQAALEEVAG